jgi:hypothetical protein
MAKGQQRGNRETKKPEKEKIKVIAAAPSRKTATPHFASASDTAFDLEARALSIAIFSACAQSGAIELASLSCTYYIGIITDRRIRRQ